jgi:DNA-binding GntR family transcriptional regulator
VTKPRGGTVDRLVEHLRNGILMNRYVPGQCLIEADLTRDFGVSRGPLREAFRHLSAEGLIQIVPHRGALVRRLSRKEALELFEIRIALEALAVRLAAKAISEPKNRARFEAAIDPIWSEAQRRSGPAYHEENRQFHQAILDVCGNQKLVELSRQHQLPLIMLQLSGAMTPAMYEESVTEHRTIATAILAGNADKAEAAVREHLERASKITVAMPDTIFAA